MNLTVITPPPFEPVSMQQVYQHLRLDPDVSSSPAETSHPDDALLAGFIQTARELVEVATRRALVQRTLRVSCGSFPASCQPWCAPLWQSRETVLRILLRRPPLVRVERVQYYDGSNVLQTVDPASYYVTDDQVPELRFVSAFGVPTVYDRPDALRVEYVAGYAPTGSPPTTQAEYAANVPQIFKDAVLIGVQLLYDNLSQPERKALEDMREAMMQTQRIQHV